MCARSQGSKASAPTFYVAQQQLPFVLWIDIYIGTVDATGHVSDQMTYMFHAGNDFEVGDWFLGTVDPTSGDYYVTGGDDVNPPYPIWCLSQNGQKTEIFTSYPTIDGFHAINSSCVLVVRGNYSDNQWSYLLETFNPQTSAIMTLHQAPYQSLAFTQGLTYFDTVTGTLFGIGYGAILSNGYLSQWNMHSGEYSMVAITGPYIVGIAYSATTKTIYGLAQSSYVGGNSWIVTIEPSTGVCKNVTSPIAYQVLQESPLLIDTTTETLYFMSSTLKSLFITEVDAATGTVSQLMLSGSSATGLFGLQFQPVL